MPEATDRYTATRLSAELGLDNRKMRDILTRVNPFQVKGRSKLYLLRDVIPHAAKYLGAPDVIDLNAERARKVKADAEQAVFFYTDDFATTASYTPSGGSASTVNGIFDNEFFEVDPLSGVGVVSAQPRLFCTTADLPSGAASGDAITIDGTAYTVRVIQPEGTGVTTLVLEKN